MTIDFSGNWSANLLQSRLLGPTPTAISIRIEQSEAELKEEMLVTKLDGSEDRLLFQCWLNGETDRNLLNGKPIRGAARWEGEELVIESRKQLAGREMHFCDRWSFSSDRQTLIMEHREGDLAGQKTVLTRVL
jgi:hypothetical protein